MFAIAGYTPTELLHQGASTIIYRGYRDADHARVIIKSHSSDFPTALDRASLRHEHVLLTELQGSGILVVHPLEASSGRVALVMEDVGLESLDRWVGARLDLGLVLRVFIGVTATLRRAHQRRILHKDIKPHNILVGADPLRTYLIDWGIASRLSELHKNQDGSQLPEAGTLAYIAPEQTGMMNRLIDARADLYALGVTFYELLTGVLPFTDESPTALLRSHLTRLPKPPSAVDPRVPAQVSEIVMKLLAKSVEDRYVSARGLELDLAECLEQWEGGGQIGAFPPGRHDRSSEFRLPQRLYGREADVAAVLSAYRRVQQGASELVLVAGHGGIGKTTIVREANGPMRLSGARMTAGKFDQFRDATPYASLAEAFRELTRQVMTEPADVMAAFRAQLLGALGQNAGVLLQLIPELERVLGPQPPVLPLGPLEAENRFHLAMLRFVSVFARAEHPLVVFLDDLQWADPASLKLIERLLTDPAQRHILIIGAYRDHDPGHVQLLTRTLSSVAEAGCAVSTISLGPLVPSDVDQMIADTLRATPPAVAALGEEIYKKTQGNPFFIGQLLTSLSRDELIWFDDESGGWRWDLPAIAGQAITSNVADFMAERLRRLAPRTLSLVKLGACLGTQFDHDTLAKLAEQSTSACANALWEALVEGLLLPLHKDYRLLAELEDARDAPGSPGGQGGDEAAVASRVTYRFLHDRVREAAYSLFDEQEKPRVHDRIARLLRAQHGAEVPDDSVFTIVDHLNLGRALVAGRAERLAAASLNLRAGRRAKASVAYAAARSYLFAGIAYLPEDAWDTAYELGFDLRNEHAASVFLCGDFSGSAELFDDLLEHARSPLLAADVHIVRIQLCTAASRYGDTVRIGRLALSSLGAPAPETDAACQVAFDAEVKLLMEQLRGRTLEDLLGAAPMSDPRMKAVLRILLLIDTPSFGAGYPVLSALTTLRQVLVSLEHGPAELSACGYAAGALMMIRKFGTSPEAELLGRLAAALAERYPCPEYTAKLSLTRAHAASITRPSHEAVARFDQAAEIGLQFGDLSVWQIASTCSLTLLFLGTDEELGSVQARYEQHKTEMQRARYEASGMMSQAALQAIACLRDPARRHCSFDDEHFEEAAFLARAKAITASLVQSLHWVFKLMVLCVHAEHEAALPLLGETAERTPIFSQAIRAHCALYLCLHASALLEKAPPDEAPRYWALFDENQGILTRQRALCEEAWRGPSLLVAAERARLLGQDIEAQRFYSQAVEHAQQNGQVRLFAMGNERYAKFSLNKGFEKLARICLGDAHQGWLSWGAVAKADALAAQFPQCFAQLANQPPGKLPTITTRGSGTVVLQGVLFDLGEAMRAAHAISSEITPARVIEQFLRASSVNSAAERAFVLLVRDDELLIAGQLTSNPDVVRMPEGEPIPVTTELCEAVARYAARSREPVILGDGEGPTQFAGDPYLREHHPRSLLCLPLLHQDRLLGLWYAENNAGSAFRQGSIELLQLLAGHAASALQNARLYEQLKAASGELTDKNLRLSRELEEREQIERERSALQEHVIRMQDEMLLELSTPLIPINDRVIVIPIIGTLGDKRASHMVATVLSGVHEQGARAVIVDLTGLRQVDITTVSVLLAMASALRLLGVRVLLTGVRPDIAQTIASMDVDMKGIVIRSTLQEGIAFAIDRRG